MDEVKIEDDNPFKPVKAYKNQPSFLKLLIINVLLLSVILLIIKIVL